MDRPMTPPEGLAPHQQRVLDERDELQGRADRLLLFTDTPTFRSLPEEDRQLLLDQLGVMRRYLEILGKRIARFEEAA